MFMAGFFVVDKKKLGNWEDLSVDEWLNTFWHIHAMQYYAKLKEWYTIICALFQIDY